MRRWMAWVLPLAAAGLIWGGFAWWLAPVRPQPDEVVSLRIVQNYPMLRAADVPQSPYRDNPHDRAVIDRVVRWLRPAPVVRRGFEPMPTKGGSFVQIRLRGGEKYTIIPRGSEVYYDTGHGTPVRLRAPELAGWLTEGWKQDVQMGETPESVIREFWDAISRTDLIYAYELLAPGYRRPWTPENPSGVPDADSYRVYAGTSVVSIEPLGSDRYRVELKAAESSRVELKTADRYRYMTVVNVQGRWRIAGVETTP